MARVRPAAYAALLLVLLFAATTAAEIPRLSSSPAAAVAWPPSSGLVVAEVVTGGASASDEYVELANAGPVPVDLAGLEVAYASSAGTSATRKAVWTASLVVSPGQHLLLANAGGAYAASADATYSGGLAATGGAIVLRATGGAVIDAVGWGDATNAFVEGTAVAAPPAGQSVERRPGGSGNNLVDTNANAADFVANAAPVPQDLASSPVPSPTPTAAPSASPDPTATAAPTETPPTPGPTASPTPAPTVSPTDSPSPSATVDPAPTATPEPSGEPSSVPSEAPSPTGAPSPSEAPSPTPTVEPTASPTVEPTASPTPDPTATTGPSIEPSPSVEPPATASPDPTPPPTVEPSPSATAIPSPSADPVAPIAVARSLADGTPVTVEGVLTTALGGLESGRTGFVQDASGGIAVYLDAPFDPPLPAGTRVRVAGAVGSRYGERTIRANRADILATGGDVLPLAVDVGTGAATEPLEGLRLHVTGVVTEAPTALSDGLGLLVDDGSGPLRVIVGAEALASGTPTTGSTVIAEGPLGQRDSTGTDLAGYRLFATLPGELVVVAPPTPSPSPTPSAPPSPSLSPSASPPPSPSPSPSPRPTPTPMPSPSASPTPSPTPTPMPSPSALAVGDARLVPVGRPAWVHGTVVAAAGALGIPRLFVIADATGGLPVRLAEGQVAPARGALVELRGTIAAPYGQTELRLTAGGLSVPGAGTQPPPLPLKAGAVGESVEGRLVAVHGTITVGAAKSSSQDVSFTIRGDDDATLRICADASSRLVAAAFHRGVVASFTGIVGQRASRKGALDGYRVWLRDAADVTATPGPSPTASPSPTPSPSAGVVPPVQSIATARVRDGETVTVEGVATVNRSLLDSSGRLTVLEDATAAIEVYLPTPDPAVRAGARLRVTGTVGRAWGALHLHATAVTVLGIAEPAVHDLRVAPGATTEWRLVRLTGTIASLHRTGDRWVAELAMGSLTVPVLGLAGSRIAASALGEGRTATIIGIVKRPYPTAADRRFAVVPRDAADVTVGDAPASPGPGGGASPGGAGTTGPGGSPGPAGGGSASTGSGEAGAAPDTDLRDLAARVGDEVRVGGLVTAIEADGFLLDDGTASARVVLAGDATDLLAVLGPGDAINAEGAVELRDEPVVVVRDAAGLVLVGDLGSAGATPSPTLAAIAGLLASSSPALSVLPTGRPGLVDPVGPGAAIVGLAALLAALGVALRRRRDRRVLRARILARLASFGASGAHAATSGAAPGAPGDA